MGTDRATSGGTRRLSFLMTLLAISPVTCGSYSWQSAGYPRIFAFLWRQHFFHMGPVHPCAHQTTLFIMLVFRTFPAPLLSLML